MFHKNIVGLYLQYDDGVSVILPSDTLTMTHYYLNLAF